MTTSRNHRYSTSTKTISDYHRYSYIRKQNLLTFVVRNLRREKKETFSIVSISVQLIAPPTEVGAHAH
jgi:hypothetical protein